jgi:hypothetical protein
VVVVVVVVVTSSSSDSREEKSLVRTDVRFLPRSVSMAQAGVVKEEGWGVQERR